MIATPSLPPQPTDELRVTAAPKCYGGGIMSTTIADKLVKHAQWCSVERQAILTSDCMITLDAAMREYLEYEADRRKTDIWTIYLEEMAADKRNRTRVTDAATLERVVQNSNPDPRRLAEDDRYPF